MSGVEVRPFRRSDRHQVTDLVNAHVQAVVPGVSVSVNAVLSQLEREPGEFVVDPWVVERVTLVARAARPGGRRRAPAPVRLRPAGRPGPARRGRDPLAALRAGRAVLAGRLGRRAGRRRGRGRARCGLAGDRPGIGADGTLPAPGVYGVPEQWPHVAGLLRRVGFSRGERTEIVLLADVAALPRPAAAVRPAGRSGRSARSAPGWPRSGTTASSGYVEVDTGIGGSGAIAGQPGWADVGNLWVQEADRGRGVGSWLLGEAAEWLRLGRVDRLLAYADPGDARGSSNAAGSGGSPRPCGTGTCRPNVRPRSSRWSRSRRCRRGCRTRPRGRSRRSVTRSIVSSGAPLRSASSLASGAVAPRAPIRWVAIRRCTPVPRISSYSPRVSSASAVSTGARSAGSQLRITASGSSRALRSRSRCSTWVPAGTPSRSATPAGAAASSRSSTRVPGFWSDRARSSNRLVSSTGRRHLAVHDLGADAALADQQALVDQLLDGPAHGRAGTGRTARPG